MNGFARDLRAEWTKLRSVRGWVLALLASVVLTVLVSLLAATASSTDVNASGEFVVGPGGQPVVDDFHFVHQPLTGSGSITARVTAQRAVQESARAGVMIKDGTRSGAAFAAIAVTPRHGVRLLSNFTVDRTVGSGAAPHWLRLARHGAEITGYESADGSTWSPVGTVDLRGLPDTVEIGLFVNSPPEVRLGRQAGSTSIGELPTKSTATFDNVRLESPLEPGPWKSEDVSRPVAKPIGGDLVQAGGVFTVTGSGDIARDAPDDDPVAIGLTGFFVGLMAVVAVGVLFMTSEYRRRMIRTTFAASPRRGRVLAAKAVVLGAVTFVAGLIASVTAFLVSQPILRDRGFAPPAFPPASLADWPVLRAVVGAAALMAAVALFSLGLGAILRRSAGAITIAVGLMLLPTIVSTFLPLPAAKLFLLVTPASGFAIQRAKEPTDALVEPWAAISPWAGFGVLCLYAAGAIGVAFWLLRRRDA